MVRKKLQTRFGAIGGSALFSIAAFGTPGTAQAGFFDQLFGAPPPISQPSYHYDAPSGSMNSPEPFVQEHRRKRVVVDEKPILQKTTDLMHDKTLRPGDAVMMKTGIKVFTGRDTFNPRPKDFTPLDSAKYLKPGERMALASMDVTRNDPLTKQNRPDTLASGRSAAVGVPVSQGVTFTDNHGKTIRYVGP